MDHKEQHHQKHEKDREHEKKQAELIEATGRLAKRQVLNMLHEADHVSALVAAVADPAS